MTRVDRLTVMGSLVRAARLGSFKGAVRSLGIWRVTTTATRTIVGVSALMR